MKKSKHELISPFIKITPTTLLPSMCPEKNASFLAKLKNVRAKKSENARVKNFHLFYIIDLAGAGHSKSFQPPISVAIRTFTFPMPGKKKVKNEISYFSLLFIFHPFFRAKQQRISMYAYTYLFNFEDSMRGWKNIRLKKNNWKIFFELDAEKRDKPLL